MIKTIKYGESQSALMRKLISRFEKDDVPQLDEEGVESLVPQDEKIMGLFKHISLDPDYHLYACTCGRNDATQLLVLKKGENIVERLKDDNGDIRIWKFTDMDIMPFVQVPFTPEALWEAFLLWDSRGIFLPRRRHANYDCMLLLTDKMDLDRKFVGQSFRRCCMGDLDGLNFDFSPTITIDEEAKTAEITFYHWSIWSEGCMKSGAKIKWHDNRVEMTPTMYPNPDYKEPDGSEFYGWEKPERSYEYIDLGIPFQADWITF